MSINPTASSYVRRSPEQWQDIIEQQKNSGLSQAAFCKNNGLCLATFANWKRELLGQTRELLSETDNDWLELPLPPEPTAQQPA